MVIASKVYFNPGRLSRQAIHREIDGSLKRLGTDYLDLYIIHRFDYDTPMEETMEALNDLVKAGKVRALGASAMYGYQFYNMQLIARDHGWARFQAMENHYNLLYREDERELIPICKQMGVSLMPYSPLAAGHLTRRTWTADTLRSRTDRVAMGKYDRTEEEDLPIVARVAELADKHGAKMQQIALAWQWARGVASPIVGATKARYLDDAAGALAVRLTEEELSYLEEPYRPHPIVGAIDHNPPQGVMLLDRVYLPRLGVSLEEQQRQQRRQELIVGMSHDLKSPMTSIRAYTEALLDGVARDEDARSRYLRTIQAKERDMEGMVDRALLARVTANLLDNSRKYGGRENVRVAISARAAGRIIHSRGWRRLRHQRRARPMSRANRVRVPTLRIRLAIGAPLRKGENSWSMGIT